MTKDSMVILGTKVLHDSLRAEGFLISTPPNTADIEQRVAEAIAKFITSWFKDKGSDLGLADLISSGKWREYL